MNTPQIVVGIDGSAMARTALSWAAVEAGRRGAQLVLAHAADVEVLPQSAAPTRYGPELLVDAELYEHGGYEHGTGYGLAGAPEHGAAGGYEHGADGAPEHGAAGSDVDGSDVDGSDVDGSDVDGSDVDGSDVDGSDVDGYQPGADLSVSTIVAPEDPVRLLTWLSEHADLVVVGSHGRGQQTGRQLGSVAFGMAIHARCPVAIVPRGWDEPAQHGKPVVVGIPASVASRIPLYVAFAEARARGVPVRAVRAWSRVDWTGNLTDLIHPASPVLEAKQQDYIERMLSPVCELYPDVAVQTVLSGKRVDDVMLAATEDAGLLVLGSRYADGRAYSRLGATTARLMHKIPCPTIVIGRVQARATGADAASWPPAHSAG